MNEVMTRVDSRGPSVPGARTAMLPPTPIDLRRQHGRSAAVRQPSTARHPMRSPLVASQSPATWSPDPGRNHAWPRPSGRLLAPPPRPPPPPLASFSGRTGAPLAIHVSPELSPKDAPLPDLRLPAWCPAPCPKLRITRGTSLPHPRPTTALAHGRAPVIVGMFRPNADGAPSRGFPRFHAALAHVSSRSRARKCVHPARWPARASASAALAP